MEFSRLTAAGKVVALLSAVAMGAVVWRFGGQIARMDHAGAVLLALVPLTGITVFSLACGMLWCVGLRWQQPRRRAPPTADHSASKSIPRRIR